jgi:predicted nucleotidyltransferase
MELDQGFQEFVEAIQLGALPEGRIASAWGRLHRHLVSAYGLAPGAVFLQGSYANDTAVKPARLTDQYDVDVVALCAASNASADEALEDLEVKLAVDADYRGRIERKTPCVRLRYASDESGYFHLDIVPARRAITAPIEIPRRGDHWKDNDPEGYRRWCLQRGQQFARTVRVLKRWRDVHQGQRRGVKSIVLQVLVANAMPPLARDAPSVAQVLRGIAGFLDPHPVSPPSLPHPVLSHENLTSSWPEQDYRVFRRHVAEGATLAEQALADPDEADSHRRWRDLLGEDFPPYRGPSPGPPKVPPPGWERIPQQPPRSERYGSWR